MLRPALNSSTLKLVEVAGKLDMDKGAFSRVLDCTRYRKKPFYDELYSILGAYGGTIPSYENVVAYPSGRETGTWDVYVDNEYFMTYRFQNYDDVIKFVRKDERYMMFSKYFIKETSFKNEVRLK